MKIQPYLFFNGRCEEAIEFYKENLSAEVHMIMRFKDNPDKPPPEKVSPSLDDKIMHASIKIGDAEIFASDGMGQGGPNFKGINLSLTVPAVADAERIFKALSKGGKVEMPIARTFFSPMFGCVSDKFGVSWMVMAECKK